MRRINGHRVAIYKSSRIEHAEAMALERCFLRCRVPRHGDEIEDRFDGFHGQGSWRL